MRSKRIIAIPAVVACLVFALILVRAHYSNTTAEDVAFNIWVPTGWKMVRNQSGTNLLSSGHRYKGSVIRFRGYPVTNNKSVKDLLSEGQAEMVTFYKRHQANQIAFNIQGKTYTGYCYQDTDNGHICWFTQVFVPANNWLLQICVLEYQRDQLTTELNKKVVERTQIIKQNWSPPKNLEQKAKK